MRVSRLTDYLARNEIPQLFQCLLSGLMYDRPSDHIRYLRDCLGRIKREGVTVVRWSLFVDAKKTPLPPIDSPPRADYRPAPLPEIGSRHLLIPFHATIVIVMAGPGVSKKDICKKMCKAYSEYVHIELGEILRSRSIKESLGSDFRWKTAQNVINEGNLVEEEFVTECLIEELNKNKEQTHFLIEGYPRTKSEREDFERFIGFHRLKFVLLVDCEEGSGQKALLQREPRDGFCDHDSPAVMKRILNYKLNTLAVCRYFDDRGKLRLVDGDKQKEIVMKDIQDIFKKELKEPMCLYPLSVPEEPLQPSAEAIPLVSVGREVVTEISPLTGISLEGNRNSELPQCRLILLLGGPGSGKSEIATRVCSQHVSWEHIDVHELLRSKILDADTPDTNVATSVENLPYVENWTVSIEVLREVFKTVKEGTEVLILEGYPNNANQVNQFNAQIGRADFVILLDSEEEIMRTRLAQRYCGTHRQEDDETNVDLRMFHFKRVGLSICLHYDELAKMCIVPADQHVLNVAADFSKVVTRKLKMINDVTKDPYLGVQISSDSQSLRSKSKLGLNRVESAFVVLLLGGPGSGKKTLGRFLETQFAVPFIYVDQIIREAVRLKSEGFEELKKYLEDEKCDETPIYNFIHKMVADTLSTTGVAFIVGFPKKVEHYKRLQSEICPVAAAIFLDVDQDTLNRRSEAVADEELRSDKVDPIEVFSENRSALLEELSKDGLLNPIDGTLDPEEVAQLACSIIELYPFMKKGE